MTPERIEELRGALASEFDGEELTTDGRPKMAAFNARLPEGVKPATAAERDAVIDALTTELMQTPAGLDDGMATIRIVSAPQEIVRLTINGRRFPEVRVGKSLTIARDLLPAVRDCSIAFVEE